MKAKNYIISNLNSFILNFPQTRVRYEFAEDIMTHYIEIVPNSIYNFDEHYINWESEFYDSFTTLFPEDNICFISDDAIVGLGRIDYELIGKSFICLTYDSSDNMFIKEEDITFDKNLTQINIIDINAICNEVTSFEPLSSLDFNISHYNSIISDDVFCIADIKILDNYYSLAA